MYQAHDILNDARDLLASLYLDRRELRDILPEEEHTALAEGLQALRDSLPEVEDDVELLRFADVILQIAEPLATLRSQYLGDVAIHAERLAVSIESFQQRQEAFTQGHEERITIQQTMRLQIDQIIDALLPPTLPSKQPSLPPLKDRNPST
jgi:hypothetical protein